MSANPIVVIGAGGHARVVIDALQCAGLDVEGVAGLTPVANVLGVPYLGTDDFILARKRESVRLANGIGSIDATGNRAAVFERFAALGYEFVRVIHPTSVIARSAHLGHGTQVMAGAVIQPAARLGKNVLVNTLASIDHDCVVGDHVHVAPGATLSGGVIVETGAHIGAGAVILQGRTVGAGAVVAAGAVVHRDVAAGTTVIGVPAKERGRS